MGAARETLVLDLPDRGLHPTHSALVLTCVGNVRGSLIPQFEDRETGAMCQGKSQVLWPVKKGRRLEMPLPDYRRMRVKLRPEVRRGPGVLIIKGVELLSDVEDEDDHILILTQTANRVVVELEDLPGPRILSFIDAYYPGWEAYVDGERRPVMRAFDVFKAVEVPAGTHEVEFVYRPQSTYIGMGIGAATLLGAAAYWIGMWPHRRRRHRQDRRGLRFT